MPLQAFQFAGDSKLEASLIEDRAHILEGAQGEHVAKIQAAIMLLDNVQIDQGELDRSFYGPSTSRAVLSYKSKRKIINFSYQNTADAIVGKMTIKTLDDELEKFQRANQSDASGIDTCNKEFALQSTIAKAILAKQRTGRPRGSDVG